MIAYQSCPRGRTLPGWGTPGSVYDGLHFRTEILDSVGVLTEAVWTQLFPHSIPPKPLNSRNRSPLADYWPLLEPETIIAADGDSAPTLVQPVLPATLAPILRLYEQHLENARWASAEPTLEDYEDCIRVVSVLMSVLGDKASKHKGSHDQTTESATSGTSVSAVNS